jgi:hypothetical protein
MLPAFFAALCFVTINFEIQSTFRELTHAVRADYQMLSVCDSGSAGL